MGKMLVNMPMARSRSAPNWPETMAVAPKIRKRREGAGSPGSRGGTGAAGACAISLDVTVVYDTAYRQASILAVLAVTRVSRGPQAFWAGRGRAACGRNDVKVSRL